MRFYLVLFAWFHATYCPPDELVGVGGRRNRGACLGLWCWGWFKREGREGEVEGANVPRSSRPPRRHLVRRAPRLPTPLGVSSVFLLTHRHPELTSNDSRSDRKAGPALGGCGAVAEGVAVV